MPDIRRAGRADQETLWRIEQAAFEPPRRSSRDSLRRSLTSPRQTVWTADGVASMVLWHHPRTLRVYGIAVHPDHQGKGLGAALLAHAQRVALKQHAVRIVLEAATQDRRLRAWYEAQGFRIRRRLPDYYGPGLDAWRMERATASAPGRD